MWRFVVIFILCMSIAPLVPGFVESRLEAANREKALAAQGTGDTGDRKHRISINRRGQFIADAYLNGVAVDMLVDTGATVTALPESVAEDIGIILSPSDFKHAVQTANGTTYGARAVIDGIRVGNIRLRNIDALVLKDRSLGGPLLGMSALSELKRFDISAGTLVLVQ